MAALGGVTTTVLLEAKKKGQTWRPTWETWYFSSPRSVMRCWGNAATTQWTQGGMCVGWGERPSRCCFPTATGELWLFLRGLRVGRNQSQLLRKLLGWRGPSLLQQRSWSRAMRLCLHRNCQTSPFPKTASEDFVSKQPPLEIKDWRELVLEKYLRLCFCLNCIAFDFGTNLVTSFNNQSNVCRSVDRFHI